jgi:hypothetical protein
MTRATNLPRRLSGRRVLAVGVSVATLLVGSVVNAEISGSARAGESADRGMQMRTDGGMPPRAVLISDSAISGIRWYGRQSYLTGTQWETYLESCRRLVAASCRGREGYAPRTAVSELRDIQRRSGNASPQDLLVIAVGYNDWHERFASDFDTVLTTARHVGFRRIVWLTFRSNNQYNAPGIGSTNYAAMNAVLRAAADDPAIPGFDVWDYEYGTAGITSWYASDGIHVTPDGAARVAEWLSRQLEFPLP